MKEANENGKREREKERIKNKYGKDGKKERKRQK